MNILALLLADFYKIDHISQYPKGIEMVYSNLTPRKSRIKGCERMVFFGLQYFIIEYVIKQFNKTFFEVDIEEVLAKYKRRMRNSLGSDLQSYQHIIDLHKLGYLPICIKAVPEGTLVNMKVPSVIIYNTDRRFAWLPNFLETILSTTIWQPSTSATKAKRYQTLFTKFAHKTVSRNGNISFVKWQGHDFSMRGMSSLESACTSGMGHLLSFYGTDTIPAIEFLEEYYGADSDKEIVGGSIPATEHSVMCMGGKESERETILRLITEVYPSGPVGIVSDTWDYFNTINVLAPSLKSEILAREGKVIWRPDSGVPEHIVAGYRPSEVKSLENGTYEVILGENTGKIIDDVERRGTIEVLYGHFGGTITEEGYKLLDSHVGCIYGERISLEVAESIFVRLEEKAFCSFNIVFGIGSYEYQYNTRDTFGIAMKATAGIINNELVEVFKDPKTDDGTKKSAKGYVRVDKVNVYEHVGNGYMDSVDYELILTDQVTWEEQEKGILEKVFENGKLIRITTLAEIRERIAA